MKKKYILIAVVCIAVLVAATVIIALAVGTGYLEKLSYDHVSQKVYNNILIVGDDGLFYLVKDGEKISKGYASLQSVNDFYENIENLIQSEKSVTLFDYYIARSADSAEYMLINSDGDEITISGESYSLDTKNTALPYLVFTDNSNGLKAVISLMRLDSDVSYKSGNELTLRPFKSVNLVSTDESSALKGYLVTEDISEETQYSYFRSDGIKLTAGADIDILRLYKDGDGYTYLYNKDDGKIISTSGEAIASDTVDVYSRASIWQYAICRNEKTDTDYCVVFSPEKHFTLSSADYKLGTLTMFANCLSVQKSDSDNVDVIGVHSGVTLGTYTSVAENGNAVTAVNVNGTYTYLDSYGKPIMTAEYGDMIYETSLSDEHCAVFSSSLYDKSNSGTYYHFARDGASVYTLNTDGAKITRYYIECEAYILEKTENGITSYRVLSPFSSVKISAEYDSIEIKSRSNTSWLTAQSTDRKVIDLIDPLTAKPVISIPCPDGDFGSYTFEIDGAVSLAKDSLDSDTVTTVCLVELKKNNEKTGILSYRKYYAIYRCAPYASENYSSSALKILELGSNLLTDSPYTAYSGYNYLAVNTSAGSEVYSIDETATLSRVAEVPYNIVNIITDSADTDICYFLVENDNGMKGLYNTDSEMVLSPYYGSISSVENGHFIVSLRGAYGVIRAAGGGKTKTVIDFKYSFITPIGDNGYYAIAGSSEQYVFDGGKKVLTSPVNRWTTVTEYSSDENGSITVTQSSVFSSDARLYMHRSSYTKRLFLYNYDFSDGK